MKERNSFLAFKLRYIDLYTAVSKFYFSLLSDSKSNHGHSFDHDLTVLAVCLYIAPDDKMREGELAAIAGLLHSIDRHSRTTGEELQMLEHYLLLLPESVGVEEKELIRRAVMEHSKKNSDKDDLVTQILKDGDRIANLGLFNYFRGGQHRPSIPALDFRYLTESDPESTFKEPKSCLDALRYNLEWEEMIRLPKAKTLAAPRFQEIRDAMRNEVAFLTTLGIFPFDE